MNDDDDFEAAKDRHPSSTPMRTHDMSFSGTGQVIYYHLASQCEGHPCPLHNPSDHSMVGWPLHLRADLPLPLMERICPHGIGHPDPDSAAYLFKRYGAGWVGIHGCDGCCAD